MGLIASGRLAVVAPLGPNPAALTELVWALVRQRGAEIVAIEVVLESARARLYWDLEIAGPGGAWSELRAALGDAIPPAEAIGTRAARLPDGAVPADARTPGIVEAMREPLWAAARAAQASGAPVVFALSGGRWRASTALAATVFQLLARPEDALVDVRISDPVAAGGTGFFFPEQRAGSLRGRLALWGGASGGESESGAWGERRARGGVRDSGRASRLVPPAPSTYSERRARNPTVSGAPL